MNIEIDKSFTGDYQCEILPEIPGGAKITHYFPSRTSPVGQDGILLKVAPNGAGSWIGLFSSIKRYPRALSRILFTPDVNRMCVICSGDVITVDVINPHNYTSPDFEPVIDAVAIKEKGIIVFAGFTRLLAIDSCGVKWQTSRVAWDGFRITHVDHSYLTGEYWDVAREKQARFGVSLDTGKVDGG